MIFEMFTQMWNIISAHVSLAKACLGQGAQGRELNSAGKHYKSQSNSVISIALFRGGRE